MSKEPEEEKSAAEAFEGLIILGVSILALLITATIIAA